MTKPKPITLEEYADVGPEFFAKFNYVKTQLPADTEVNDILTIMETLAGLVMIKRDEVEETRAIGFLGNLAEEEEEKTEEPDTYRMGF